MSGSYDRRLLTLLAALFVASYACVRTWGPTGMAPIVVLWLAAFPYIAGPELKRFLRAEWVGVAFIFANVGYVDALDAVFGYRIVFFLPMFLAGVYYLGTRWREALRVARAPVAIFFLVFLAQQVVNTWVLDPVNLYKIFEYRVLVAMAFIGAGVLTAQPGGRQLFPLVLMLAALMCVPVLMRELVDPDAMQVFESFESTEVRAGGFYQQPNIAGIGLSFGAVGAALLFLQERIRARTLVVLMALFMIGIGCTVSRGGFFTMLVLGVVTWGFRVRQQARGARGIVGALAVVALLGIVIQPTAEYLVRASDKLQESGVTDISRLQEVLLLISGHPDALMEDDSRRVGLVEEALKRIDQKPIFGYGTGNFMQDFVRSHVQFLDVLGENGLVGGAFYACVLIALGLTLARLRERDRMLAVVAASAWFITHFHNHNVVETPMMMVPIGFICGLDVSIDPLAERGRVAPQAA